MNRHRGATAYAYVDERLHADAKDALERSDWNMTAVITATLVALTKHPDRLFKFLTPYRQTPRPPGRPKEKD